MNRLAKLLAGMAFVVGLAGCGSQAAKAPAEPKDRLLGQWSGTVQVNEEGVRNALPPAQVEGALASLHAMRMKMDFRKDGKLVLVGENQGRPYESQVSWELVSHEGDKMTLRSIEPSKEEGVGPQEKTIDIRFDGGDAFEMPLSTEIAELGSLRFTRLR